MTRTALLVLAACGTAPAPADTAITGTIDHDTTWAGTPDLQGFVSIPAGVTVTVPAGTSIHIAEGSQIDVAGTLAIEGAAGNVATLASSDGEFWFGVSVEGTYTMHYGVQHGGGMYTNAPDASITVFDSELSTAIGDYLVTDGGSVDVEYTNLGVEAGDHSHCNLHFNSASSITFSHNTNAGSSFGLMLYGGHGDFRHNNWIHNLTDIEPNPGGTGTFDDSYFASGIPGGVPGSTFANPSSTRLADCGPR